MDNRMTQKKYKQLKKEVAQESALGVGYYETIFEKLPAYALVEATRKISSEGWVRDQTPGAVIQNMLVTESIKEMNYQDFKEVAPYLFSYPREQRSQDLLVRPVEISRAYFEELKAQADELFRLNIERKENDVEILQATIQEVETKVVPSSYEVLGVNLATDELLVLSKEPSDYLDFVYDERLLVDYRERVSARQQIMDALMEYPQVEDYIQEFFNDNYYEATGTLDGLEDVENYYIEHGLDTQELASVTTTAELWELAQQIPAFQEDYERLSDFIDTLGDHTYIYDNADQIFDYPNHLEAINDLLTKEGKGFIYHEARGYSQGDLWELGAIYDLEKDDPNLVQEFLEHEVGAAYRGSLLEAYVLPLSEVMSQGFQAARNQAEIYMFDEEQLFGKEELDQVAELLKLEGFISPEVAEKELKIQESTHHKGEELTR